MARPPGRPSASAIKAPSFADELFELARKLRDVPYTDIEKLFAEAGWIVQLRQTDAVPCYNGSTLVTLDIYVGKAISALERVDAVSVVVAPGPGPVSAAARIIARETVTFILSGRLPNPPPQAPTGPVHTGPVPDTRPPNGAAERSIDMTGRDGDVVLPGERGSVVDIPPSEERTLNVVESTTPDGVPVFRDLYDIGPEEAKDTAEIIDAVLDAVTAFLETATSVEQINAFGAKNLDGLEFIKDLGTEEDSAEFLGLINRKREELSRPPAVRAATRKRSPAVPRAN